MCKLVNLVVAVEILCLIGWTVRVVAEEQPVKPASASQPHKATKQAAAKKPNKAKKIAPKCSYCPKMVTIPAGSIVMGSPESEVGRNKNESLMHKVKIASFALGMTEITRAQFAYFVKDTGYAIDMKCWIINEGKYEERKGYWGKVIYTQTDSHPVICVSWNDATAYAAWLSKKTGMHYRLPTEAEWEYAARAKTLSARYWGESPDAACKYANSADQSAVKLIKAATVWLVHSCEDGYAFSAPVGSFMPNAFGLYDMLGNVWEWVEDGYHANYKGAPIDGSAWVGNGKVHILRGGSWYDAPRFVRAAGRDKAVSASRYDNIGFRIARTLP